MTVGDKHSSLLQYIINNKLYDTGPPGVNHIEIFWGKMGCDVVMICGANYHRHLI